MGSTAQVALALVGDCSVVARRGLDKGLFDELDAAVTDRL